MMKEKFRNSKITAWLLPVVLVLSLFAFSGINSPSTAKSCNARTEQIDPLPASNKRCISYKVLSSKVASLGSSIVNFQHVTFSYTNAVKTQVSQCTKQCLEFIVLNGSLPLFTPRSLDEDFRISQHG